jgi:hypothetical protein
MTFVQDQVLLQKMIWRIQAQFCPSDHILAVKQGKNITILWMLEGLEGLTPSTGMRTGTKL